MKSRALLAAALVAVFCDNVVTQAPDAARTGAAFSKLIDRPRAARSRDGASR